MKNRDLSSRISSLRQDIVIMHGAALEVAFAEEDLKETTDMARGLSRYYDEVAQRLVGAEKATEILLDEGATGDVVHDFALSLGYATALLWFSRRTAMQLSRIIGSEHDCTLLDVANTLEQFHVSAAQHMSDLRKDASEVLQAMPLDTEELFEEGGPENSDRGVEPSRRSNRTRLTANELAGVLGVEVSEVIDAVSAHEEIDGHDVAWWYVDEVGSDESRFDVPNRVLRNQGAEALIDDSPNS